MNANKETNTDSLIKEEPIIDHEAVLLGHKHYEQAIREYLDNHISAYKQFHDRCNQQVDFRSCDFYDGCVYALQTMLDYHELQSLIFTQFINGQR